MWYSLRAAFGRRPPRNKARAHVRYWYGSPLSSGDQPCSAQDEEEAEAVECGSQEGHVEEGEGVLGEAEESQAVGGSARSPQSCPQDARQPQNPREVGQAWRAFTGPLLVNRAMNGRIGRDSQAGFAGLSQGGSVRVMALPLSGS